MNLQELNNLEIFKKEKLLSLKKLKNQGFCNINYKLTSSKKTYLVRVFKNDTHDITKETTSIHITRSNEYKIQKKAWKKQLAPEPFYLDTNKSFMITEYLKGIHKYKLEKNEIESLVKNISKLHKIKNFKNSNKLQEHDLKSDFYNFKKVLKDDDSKKIIVNSLMELKKISSYKTKLVVTHHDLNPKNIIFYKKSIRFIDWEYTGINNCFFDLASICVEFNLDKTMQKFLLSCYFKNQKNKENKIKKKEQILSLNSYMKIYKNLCILWFRTYK